MPAIEPARSLRPPKLLSERFEEGAAALFDMHGFLRRVIGQKAWLEDAGRVK